MNKTLYFIPLFAAATLGLTGCRGEGESDLLAPKVYFDNKEYTIEVADQAEVTYDLKARLSSKVASDTKVAYTVVADTSVVKQFNKKNGTNYILFKSEQISLSQNEVNIPSGALFAENSVLTLGDLSKVEEGKNYVLPVRIETASLPVIDGSNMVYIVLRKPVRLLKAVRFSSSAIKVPLLPSHQFKSITYEALINPERFGSNNTVMGREGALIFRIGDEGGGLPRDEIQIAGNKQFQATQKMVTRKWQHVAFTFDHTTGKAVIYINGVKASESTWDNIPATLNGEDSGSFWIGKVKGFMWGERPFFGQMCEVRLWTKARTENEINQSMLSVDPTTDGLLVYYKMNGDDLYEESGTWYIKNATGKGIDGVTYPGWSNGKMPVDTLDEPIAVK